MAKTKKLDPIPPGEILAEEFMRPNRISQKLVGGSALPFRITRRKMRADVAVSERAEQRVHQCMQANITVRMGNKTLAVRHPHAADPAGRGLWPAVHTQPEPDRAPRR